MRGTVVIILVASKGLQQLVAVTAIIIWTTVSVISITSRLVDIVVAHCCGAASAASLPGEAGLHLSPSYCTRCGALWRIRVRQVLALSGLAGVAGL